MKTDYIEPDRFDDGLERVKELGSEYAEKHHNCDLPTMLRDPGKRGDFALHVLYKCADDALYKAKDSGRNNFQVFEI